MNSHYIRTHLVSAFIKYPTVCFFAIAATLVSFSYISLGVRFDNFTTIYTLVLGFPLFFAAELLIENKIDKSKPKKILVYLVCGLFLFAFNHMVETDGTYNFYIKVFQISFIVHLVVSFIVFLDNKNDKHFWSYNYLLLNRFIHSGIFSFVFFIGILIAVVTVEKLFGLDIPKKMSHYIFVFSALFLSTCFFLAGAPKKIMEYSNFGQGQNKIPVLVQYLLVPLIFLYIFILYIYLGKILFSQVWPSGYVGWLVTIVSFFGVLVLLILDKYKTNNQWIKKLSKFYYISIIPLLIMLFIAIFKRISQYGITEKRYFLVVLGASLFFLSFYYIFSKRKSIKVIPITLFVISIVTLFGPWSAYNVSKKSQLQKFEDLLKTQGLLKNGKLVPSEFKLPHVTFNQISNITYYLLKYHGKEVFAPWFPESVLSEVGSTSGSFGYRDYTKSRNQSAKPIFEHMNLISKRKDRAKSNYKEFSFDSNNALKEKPLDIKKYNKVFTNVHLYNFNTKINIEGSQFTLKENMDLNVDLLDGTTVVIPIAKLLAGLQIALGKSDRSYEHYKLKLRADGRDVLFVLGNVRGKKHINKDNQVIYKIQILNGLLFLSNY